MPNKIKRLLFRNIKNIESKGVSLIFDTELEEKTIAFDPDKIERISIGFSDIYNLKD